MESQEKYLDLYQQSIKKENELKSKFQELTKYLADNQKKDRYSKVY